VIRYSAHQMIDAAVCPGGEAAYIHLHNAKRGCFSCAVRRID